MPRTRITTLAALLLAALFLAGCGGSGGGEPTVTQTLHDELQAELDAALADLEKERKAKADGEAARETAEGAVTRLRGELETATDNATRLTDELATATTGVGRLTAQLATANNNVESLTDRIGTADDADSLQGMLAAEKARVTTLTNQIGTATDTANAAESASLYAQLKAAKAKVTELTGEIGDTITPNSLKARLATAQARVTELEGTLRNADDQVSRLTRDLATARGERDIARQRADDAEDERDTARGQAQGLEANQRAEKLLKVLEAFTPADPGGSGRVAISVPSRNNLTFKQSGYTPRTLSASGLRGAKLTRTQGGTQTTVVYTDIELSRSLIKNYDTDAADAAETIPANDITGLGAGNFLADTDAFVITGHGFPSSQPVDRPDEKMGRSFRGTLNGVRGMFECVAEDCMTLTATYASMDRGAKLTELEVRGIATFKPDSPTATVSLCDKPRSQCAATDIDYMAFGYWRSESSDPQGAYQFEPFAFGPRLSTTMPTGGTDTIPLEYNGTAVGMYVEQNQVGAAVTKKQGEFIADARLAHNGTILTGTVDAFKTTPTGGSAAPTTTGWVVKLGLDADDTALATPTNTTLVMHGPDGSGTWMHEYTTDVSAVVGTFESALNEVLHIAGAFGAKR